MSTYTRWFVDTINKMHGIRTLRLRLQRLLLGDLQVLEKFPCRTPARNIIVEACTCSLFSNEPMQQMVLEKFRQWGWEVTDRVMAALSLQDDDDETD